MTVSISDVPALSKKHKALCRRAKIFNTDQLLLNGLEQLATRLRLSRVEARAVYRAAAQAALPAPRSVLHLLDGTTALGVPDADLPAHATHTGSDTDSDAETSGSDEQPIDLPLSSIVPQTQIEGQLIPEFFSSGSEGSDTEEDEHPKALRYAANLEPTEDHLEHEWYSAQRSPATGPIELDQQIHGHPDEQDYLCQGRTNHLLSSGEPRLDQLLNGGFRKGALTEIVGESASGKTQLAIQTAVYACLGLETDLLKDSEDGDGMLQTSESTLPSSQAPQEGPRTYFAFRAKEQQCERTGVIVGCGVALITSGGERTGQAFIRRATQVAELAVRSRIRNQRRSTRTQDDDEDDDMGPEGEVTAVHQAVQQLFRNVHIACVADMEALDHALKYTLPGLQARINQAWHDKQNTFKRGTNDLDEANSQSPMPLGLVIIDSLPPLFHEESTSNSMETLVQRTRTLVDIADALKVLSLPSARYDHGKAILVLNHVSDAFGKDRELANRFVYACSDRIREKEAPLRLGLGDFPRHSVNLPYADQGAFFTGLLASVPPTLAETLSRREAGSTSKRDGELYVLHPRTAQLGHVWTNSINVRLMLSKTRGRHATETLRLGMGASTLKFAKVRRATVVFSSYGPSFMENKEHVRFVIQPEGIVALRPYQLSTTQADSAEDESMFASLDLDDEHLAALEMAETSASTVSM